MKGGVLSSLRNNSGGYGTRQIMRQAPVLAYVLAPHEDVAFLELKSLLKPFGITQFFTDGWGAYQRHLDQQVHIIGKSNTQKIERKHLTSENKDQTFSTQDNLLL